MVLDWLNPKIEDWVGFRKGEGLRSLKFLKVFYYKIEKATPVNQSRTCDIIGNNGDFLHHA